MAVALQCTTAAVKALALDSNYLGIPWSCFSVHPTSQTPPTKAKAPRLSVSSLPHGHIHITHAPGR